MKRLFLALAVGAGLAAPACAQSTAPGQPETYRGGASSLGARTFTPVAPASQMTAAPDTFSPDLASQEAYDAGVSDSSHWTQFEPVQAGDGGWHPRSAGSSERKIAVRPAG